jgi:CBS domain-containing protein
MRSLQEDEVIAGRLDGVHGCGCLLCKLIAIAALSMGPSRGQVSLVLTLGASNISTAGAQIFAGATRGLMSPRHQSRRQGSCSTGIQQGRRRRCSDSHGVRDVKERVGAIMKVREIMTRPPQSCQTGTNLSAASRHMRATRCGTLVVTDPRGRLVGLLTDRDLALAVGDLTTSPSRVTVDQVMTRRVFTCLPDDDIQTSLAEMAHRKVRRLPVVDGDGDIKGMLSIDDIILWATESRAVGLHDTIRALRAIVASSEVAFEWM